MVFDFVAMKTFMPQVVKIRWMIAASSGKADLQLGDFFKQTKHMQSRFRILVYLGSKKLGKGRCFQDERLESLDLYLPFHTWVWLKQFFCTSKTF